MSCFTCILTVRAPSKIICSRRHSNSFFFHFSEKTSLDISCAEQMMHEKCQDLFSLKHKIKIQIIVCYSSGVERKTVVTQTYFINPCLRETLTPL